MIIQSQIAFTGLTSTASMHSDTVGSAPLKLVCNLRQEGNVKKKKKKKKKKEKKKNVEIVHTLSIIIKLLPYFR